MQRKQHVVRMHRILVVKNGVGVLKVDLMFVFSVIMGMYFGLIILVLTHALTILVIIQ